MLYRIDPTHVSKITGHTYAEAVSATMSALDIPEGKAQDAIDLKQFVPKGDTRLNALALFESLAGLAAFK